MTDNDYSRHHPARYSRGLLEQVSVLLPANRWKRVLDPFAGTGRIFDLAEYGDYSITAVEIEAGTEIVWKDMHPELLQGDATSLDFFDEVFQAVVTSPCYGNRMGDHHDAQDASRRNTYAHTLGRLPSEGSAAVMQWGEEYRQLHTQAWREVWRVLDADGRMILNIKDHVRGGSVAGVAGWHITALQEIGFDLFTVVAVAAPGNRNGANAELRAGNAELLCVFDKPGQSQQPA